MAAAPLHLALSAMNEMMKHYVTGEVAVTFEQIRVPVVTVNGSLWPFNNEANPRHMMSYEAAVMKDADHLLIMVRPSVFSRASETAIQILVDKLADR